MYVIIPNTRLRAIGNNGKPDCKYQHRNASVQCLLELSYVLIAYVRVHVTFIFVNGNIFLHYKALHIRHQKRHDDVVDLSMRTINNH